jgi:hypothetical protein
MQKHVLIETAGSGLRSLVEQRIESALGDFADRISWVSASLQDLPGAPDGRSRQCQIEVVLTSASVLEVQARAADAEAAVSLATKRIGRRVSAELDRMQALEDRGDRSYSRRSGHAASRIGSSR